MQVRFRPLGLVLLCVFSAPLLRAQPPADPSGHWEGTLRLPDTSIGFQIDLARNDTGDLTGTLSVPAQELKGLPLAKVVVERTHVHFSARTDQQFEGVLSPDGKIITGSFSVGGQSAPFSLSRTGEARIEPRPRSPRVSKELEGTWNGILDGDGKQLRLVLTMANQPDGTASGSIVLLDEGGLELPAMITQETLNVTLETTAIQSSFSGALDPERAELVGTFRRGAIIMPGTFRRAGGH